ncbi:MAG: transcriptional regulator [Desulfuromonadales bacterium]|nr:transcriptional regulator [Desulfuromonadales bacterium]
MDSARKSGPKRGKPAKKYSQAARLHDVIRILEARFGATVDDLAEECAVTRRTVYRDLDAIRDAGYPLVAQREADGRMLYRFITGFRKIPPITFSLDELMTLSLCRGQLNFLHGTPFADELNAIFGKIHSSLPPRSVAHLERIAHSAAPRYQGARDYSTRRELITELRRALLFQYRCTLHYTPPHRAGSAYLVDPYTLLVYDTALYVVGYVHNRGANRLFLVDRLDRIEVSEQRFEVPEDFSPDAVTGDAFGLIDDEKALTIRVRFGRQVAHLIRERQWHPSQIIDEQTDGALILSLTAAGEKELLSWLYSYLPDVEVLQPESLRLAFRAALEKGLKGAKKVRPVASR